MCPMTRRRWLQSVGGAGLATVHAKAGLQREQNGKFPLFDAHIHIWSADRKKFPLAPGFREEDLWSPSYSIEEYWGGCGPAGVTHVNLIQMTWYGLDHSYIIDVIRRDPRHFVGTGVVPALTDVSLPRPDRTMVALSKEGILAFRLRSKRAQPPFRDGPRWLDHPGYEKMFSAGAENNLALSFLLSAYDLPEISRMCSRFPETPVILDHQAGVTSKPLREKAIQALCHMARHKRVMVKIGAFSAFGERTPPYTDQLPVIRRVVDAFGPERCMWETDSPVQRPGVSNPPVSHSCRAMAELIRDHADFLSVSDKKQILFKTAHDFFFER